MEKVRVKFTVGPGETKEEREEEERPGASGESRIVEMGRRGVAESRSSPATAATAGLYSWNSLVAVVQ